MLSSIVDSLAFFFLKLLKADISENRNFFSPMLFGVWSATAIPPFSLDQTNRRSGRDS